MPASKWINVQLMDIAELKYGKSPKDVKVESSPYPIYGTSGINGFAEKPLFKGPVILVGRKGTIDKPIYISEDCWIIDTAFGLVHDDEKVDIKWLYYFLDNYKLERLNEATGVPSLSKANLDNIQIPLPTKQEQLKIAAILSTVDEAIEKTEAIIEQTEKVKKGLMQQLLMKGIGHTKFKKTEIGEIPENWEVMNIGRVCKEIYRYPTYYNIDYVEKGVPEIRGEMLKPNGEIDTNPENIRYISEETASRFPRTKLEKHDIVLSVRGTIGKVGIVPSELAGANITANLIRLSPKEHIIDKIYFKYFLLSDKFKKSLEDISTATTIKTLKAPELKNIPIPVPDLIEQRKIVSIMKTIDKKLLNETTTLDKLNSIKKFLMQVLLTGKVRVKVDDEVMSQ